MQRSLLLIYSFGLVLATIALGACSLVGHTLVTRTLIDAIPGLGKNTDDIPLNPSLRCLRVTVRGRVALMVLGYVEPHPEGVIDTWYSREGELIRLQNGRVVATAGLETNWRMVKNFSLPAWKDMLAQQAGPKPLVYPRERDEMPGYRYGIAESVSLYPVRAPSNAKLVGLPVQDLRWYEETVLGQPDGLPSARFALHVKDGDPRVIYGEQCLSQNLCFSWQTWPATHSEPLSQ